MIALIDADIVAYRAAASCMPTKTKFEEEPLNFAIARVDESMHRILGELETEQYHSFLTGSENFRKIIYPEYKANRKDMVLPRWLNDCKEYLIEEWESSVCNRHEADDAIGIYATFLKEKAVIASIDKDLRQIPGKHFNFVTGELISVNEDQADLNFWMQMLMGDRSDNVIGIYGIGPVKAELALKHLKPHERQAYVLDMYGDEERFLLNYRLLRVVRTEKELEDLIGEGEREESTEVSA